MKSFIAEFKEFVIKGNAFELAVGIVIGAAFTAVTNSLVNNILTPPLGLLMGGINFTNLGFTLAGDAVIGYGAFIQAVINLLITAFALFLVIKLINKLKNIAKKKEEEEAAAPAIKSAELQVLEEIRDSLKAGK